MGRNVTFMTGLGEGSFEPVTRNFCSSTARIATASIIAKPLPMQTRGPAPKGMKA